MLIVFSVSTNCLFHHDVCFVVCSTLSNKFVVVAKGWDLVGGDDNCFVDSYIFAWVVWISQNGPWHKTIECQSHYDKRPWVWKKGPFENKRIRPRKVLIRTERKHIETNETKKMLQLVYFSVFYFALYIKCIG